MLSLLERFHCNPVGALSASVYNGGISQDVIICEGMCYYIIYCAREKTTEIMRVGHIIVTRYSNEMKRTSFESTSQVQCSGSCSMFVAYTERNVQSFKILDNTKTT